MADAAEIVLSFLDALDRRQGDALGALLAEEAVYDPGDGPRLVGASAIRTALIVRATALGERHSDAVMMQSEDGRRVAAEVTLRGRYERTLDGLPQASGQAYAVPACLVLEIEDRRIVRVTRYIDHERWMSALKA